LARSPSTARSSSTTCSSSSAVKWKRKKKKLSKAVYGTSHTISLAEAKHVYQTGAARLLIGAGQYGTVGLSEEAASYFQHHRCQVELLPTPEVIAVWNQAEGAVIAMLHVTC
jgi:hypothetical protein